MGLSKIMIINNYKKHSVQEKKLFFVKLLRYPHDREVVNRFFDDGEVMKRFFLVICIAVVLVTGNTEILQARTLYWQDMQVRARLDRFGILHVSELQTMVFNGAWNGGERRFLIRSGQKLHLDGLYRIDAAGNRIPLVRGNLTRVDHYSWAGDNVLRWRSRLPTDPPFNNRTIPYILEYTLSGILQKQGNTYLLNHDFSFPDRSGPINRFSLDLELDPVWQGLVPVPRHHEQQNIPPGQGVVLTTELQYAGNDSSMIQAGRTGAADVQRIASRRPTQFPSLGSSPTWLRYLLLLCTWLFLLIRLRSFFLHEKKLHRFKPLPSPEQINRSWLETHVFSLLPEEVGANWDKLTDASEVAAVLARLVVEGKIESYIEKNSYHFFGRTISGLPGSAILHLKLLVPRSEFNGYERKLVSELFIAGDETDTKTIRDYYQSTTHTGEMFNPVERIKAPLKKRMDQLTGSRENNPEYRWVPSTLLAVTGFFLFFANVFFHLSENPAGPIMLAVQLVLYIITVVQAVNYRNKVDRLYGRLILFQTFLLLNVSVFSFYLLQPAFGSPLLLLSLFFFCLAIINNILNLAKTKDSMEGVLLRQRLGAARNYFKQELTRKKPDIEDDWFPYLLAFGLGPSVDVWFKRYGPATNHWTGTAATSGAAGSGGFTGGGGLFGGGGVSGTWSTAVSGFSSSAGGGGGGFSGGGGSSGGGGGGGW